MDNVISVSNLSKTYASGFRALKDINLAIRKGEIFALLGPNGAGKTTLISIICGVVKASTGKVAAGGHDIVSDYRAARQLIGLVPQEMALPIFETTLSALRLSRGLFGLPSDDAAIEKTLRSLSLWDKRNAKIATLSGGMKRRVMIAKALVHEPRILFLDEPTAGVDVELRRDMWALIRGLRDQGVTVILTTHYIEEAEELADRIGIILRGELILVEEKQALIRKLGRKQMTLHLQQKLASLPPSLTRYPLTIAGDGEELVYTFDTTTGDDGIGALLSDLAASGVSFKDIQTEESSLEDIFVDLVRERA
jgi:ABC-2 type transport system ATP-binding protein